MAEPLHCTPLTVLVDIGHDVLQIGPMMQVVEIGMALRIVTCFRVRGNVVDFFISHPDLTSVIQGFKVLTTGSDHDFSFEN
jgi:hypothetical protein